MQNHFFFGPTNLGGAKSSEERELPLPRRAAALGSPQRAAQEWTNCFHALDKKSSPKLPGIIAVYYYIVGKMRFARPQL